MMHFRNTAMTAFAMAVLGTGIAWAQTPPSEKKIYCWNEGGRKVCGDALPASAANSARDRCR